VESGGLSVSKVGECDVESVWHVDQVSPAGCTSIRIATTLRYEYHLFMVINT
jgi:hypothetical protein